MERTPRKPNDSTTVIPDGSRSPIADAVIRSLGAVLDRFGATNTRVTSRRPDLSASSVHQRPVSILSEHVVSMMDEHDLDSDAEEEALLERLLAEQQQRKRMERRTMIVLLQAEVSAAAVACTQMLPVDDDIITVSSVELPVPPITSSEVHYPSVPITSLPVTYSTSRGTTVTGVGAASMKHKGAPRVLVSAPKKDKSLRRRPALALTNARRLQDENDFLRSDAKANAQLYTDMLRRLEDVETVRQSEMLMRSVLQPTLPTGAVQRPPGNKQKKRTPVAWTYTGDHPVVAEDEDADDSGEEDRDDDGDADGDTFSADTHGAADVPANPQYKSGLTKQAVAEAAALAARAARAAELIADFEKVTLRGRVTVAMVARALASPNGGLMRQTAVGSVIVQHNDSSNRKGPVVREVQVIRGTNGLPVGARTGLASGDHTMVFPLSMEEVRLMFEQEIAALACSDNASLLSPRIRLERIQSIQAFEKLLMAYLQSLFGPFSPYAGSRNHSQWGNWIEVMITMWMFWNAIMLADEVSGVKSLSSLVTGFNQAFNNSGSQALSSAHGGKTATQTLMVDVLAILAVSCMACHRREASENLCLSCHNSGSVPFPGGFHASIDSRGEDVPDDQDFTTFCQDPVMVAQYNLTRFSSLKQKVAAYRVSYPGRPIHMQKVSTGKAAPLSRDVFLAMLRDKQGYIGVSGLQGDAPVRPSS
jgi:hypothetical protein